MSRNTQKENPARVSLAPASLPLALVPPETGAGFRMPWLRRAHISQHMAKDPHEEGTVPPPACVLLQGLVALGLFVVALLLVWGVCHWFFFPRLETKKTQEGEKMRKKKKSKLGMPNTFKTQVCLNTLQIPLWWFLSLSASQASLPLLSVAAAQIPVPAPAL